MFKSIAFHATLNDRTGFGIHAANMVHALSKLIQVNVNGPGDVHISLLDVVTASQTTIRQPYPSILWTVWESTVYPDAFMDKLCLYDSMWVVSEWERSYAIAQGINEEFIKVIPEGVDPEVYKPEDDGIDELRREFHFNFLHVGQWQPRKSTKEICEAFLKAFPGNEKVRLYLSADTLFPSDDYKSTEERLKAYGLEDPRIIPVHFEERDAYIRRLQSAHVFVSCSRAEGWGLPIIEAMACGIPTIVADWSGSTEYTRDALLVRVPELRKPEGIYGGWDVPGQWGEPDYDHLVEVMKDAYTNYSKHKEKAFKTSEMIRTKFSWEAAAKKAYEILAEIPEAVVIPADKEKDIRTYARRQGYDIVSMQKRRVIFTIDTHPSTPEKMETLIETIVQVKELGYPVLVSSHVALPKEIIEMVDYYIYDKKDILSGEDKPIYWRKKEDGTTETVQSSIPCHALAAVHNVRNSVDFCLGKCDWIYQMSSDTEIDLNEWIEKVHASEKDAICIKWQNQSNTISGQIIAAKTELMDKIVLHIDTWEDFTRIFGEDRFCSEKGTYKMLEAQGMLERFEFLTMEVGNRYDQVDRAAWGDKDELAVHFVEGPFLHINPSLSGREYDVSFGNPIDGENYYTLKQKPGMWSRPDKKYYRDWTITAKLNGEIKLQHKLDLKDNNVIISMGSKALGDTLAWIPYVEEFRKKHGCHIYCSTWWNHIMDYSEIKFIKPGDAVEDVYATYDIGCFDNQLDRNVTDWRLTPLQKVSADILGLEYEPLRAKLKVEPRKKSGNGKEVKPYICFSEFSTMQNKLWNREGAWQKVIDYLNSLGYDCVSISVEPSALQGIVKHNGQSIEQMVSDVAGAEFYIGLNAGPTWLAYSLGIPTIMITGVSEEWNDFPTPYRISLDICKPGCFNDPSLPINRGWHWCPRNRDYDCTKKITEVMVIETIERLRKDKGRIKPTPKRKTGRKMQTVQEVRL